MAYPRLHDEDHPVIAKVGLSANVNATATLNQATLGELFYAIDTGQFYIFNGTINVPLPALHLENTWTDSQIFTNIKLGATQVGAGASVGELWKTSGHATLPDNVLMIGA